MGELINIPPEYVTIEHEHVIISNRADHSDWKRRRHGDVWVADWQWRTVITIEGPTKEHVIEKMGQRIRAKRLLELMEIKARRSKLQADIELKMNELREVEERYRSIAHKCA